MRAYELFENLEPEFEFDDDKIEVTYLGSKAKLERLGDDLYLNRIETKSGETGKGSATAIMSAITHYADEHHKRMFLHVVPNRDEDFERTIKFYEKFGFRSIKPNHFKMIRLPR